VKPVLLGFTDVFSTELGIWLSFVKTSEFRGVGVVFETPKPRPPLPYATARLETKPSAYEALNRII
jgi:hypothetical protein